MYAEVWSARNDPSVKTLVYEGLIADAPNGYMDHLPIIDDFLGLKRKNHLAIAAEAEGHAVTKIETTITTAETSLLKSVKHYWEFRSRISERIRSRIRLISYEVIALKKGN